MGIFVSYRRDDTRHIAARIREHLVKTFRDVFMDIDYLKPGERFDAALKQTLDRTDVLLAVIGPRWAEILTERQRGDECDFVREEITGALKRGITVIPLLIDGTPLPRAAGLPEDLRDLVLHQAHTVAFQHFGRDLAALTEAMLAVQPGLTRASRATAPSLRWSWMAMGAAGGLAVTWAAAHYWPWPEPRIAEAPLKLQQAEERASREKQAAEAAEAARREAEERAARYRAAKEKAEWDRAALEDAKRLADQVAAEREEQSRKSKLLTFRVTSLYPYQVDLEFHSPSRRRSWPGGNRVYSIDDGREREFTLNCIPGEEICYGAWPRGNSRTFWGCGSRCRESCKGCCYACGGGDVTVRLGS